MRPPGGRVRDHGASLPRCADCRRAFLKQAVEGAKRNGRRLGICGQTPSDCLDIARYLVGIEIDSMSLAPDSGLKTMRAVVELEKELGRAVRRPQAA